MQLDNQDWFSIAKGLQGSPSTFLGNYQEENNDSCLVSIGLGFTLNGEGSFGFFWLGPRPFEGGTSNSR
jgi:hypothetical protein